MNKTIVTMRQRGMGQYAIIIFFNMDVFNKLSDGSPDIYFKKKVRLFITLRRNLYFDSLHILYSENVGTDRISGTSKDYTRPVSIFVHYEYVCEVRRYF